MTIDYTRLRELAEAATKGEWEYDGHEGVCSQDGDMHRSVAYPFKAADAAYIAAANPAVVLGLLDALERERARGDAATKRAEIAEENLFWSEKNLTRMGEDIGHLQTTRARQGKRIVGFGRLERALWNSRRMWQQRALIAESNAGKHPHRCRKCREDNLANLQIEREYQDQLAEARAWGAWFTAERDWKLAQRREIDSGLRAAAKEIHMEIEESTRRQLEDAEARVAVLEGVVAKVRELHAPEESAITKLFCPVCSEDEYLEPWPCETVRILDQAERGEG